MPRRPHPRNYARIRRSTAPQPQPQVRERVNCQRLAQDLVDRGLAPPTILGRALRWDEISRLEQAS